MLHSDSGLGLFSGLGFFSPLGFCWPPALGSPPFFLSPLPFVSGWALGSGCGGLVAEIQSGVAGRVGQRGHAAVVLVLAAIEGHLADAGGQGPLGDRSLPTAAAAALLPPYWNLPQPAPRPRCWPRPACGPPGRRSSARKCACGCGTRSAGAGWQPLHVVATAKRRRVALPLIRLTCFTSHLVACSVLVSLHVTDNVTRSVTVQVTSTSSWPCPPCGGPARRRSGCPCLCTAPACGAPAPSAANWPTNCLSMPLITTCFWSGQVTVSPAGIGFCNSLAKPTRNCSTPFWTAAR